jgi:hypothetical protein
VPRAGQQLRSKESTKRKEADGIETGSVVLMTAALLANAFLRCSFEQRRIQRGKGRSFAFRQL